MAEDTLQDAVLAFQSWRKARGYAENTYRRDASTLMAFLRSAGPRTKVSALTATDIDMFFSGRQLLSPQTQNLDLTTLRTFLTYLETRGWHRRATYLLSDYRALKHAAEPRRRVPAAEFPALLDSAREPRDRALLSLGLYLFLRTSEIRLLRVSNVSLSSDEISVIVPKTKDADVMPISSELALELRSWLTHYSTTVGELDPEWFLIPAIFHRQFLRHPDGRMIGPAKQELIPDRPVPKPEKVVQKSLSSIGWSGTMREGVHTLRRSGARALYDELAGSDGHSNALETVSAMLHHKVMATTQIYLGLTESRRKRDRLIAGRPMFPSLSDTSVTPIGVRHDRAHG